jgi:hypothetical protein
MIVASRHPSALLGLSVALGLALALPAIGCRSGAKDGGLAAMSAQEIQRLMIEGKVLPGTTVEELPAALDSLGLDYTREPVEASTSRFSPEYGIAAGTFVVVGTVDREVRNDVSVLIVLDGDMRVERVIVEEQTPL